MKTSIFFARVRLAVGISITASVLAGSTVLADGLAGASELVGTLADLSDLEPLAAIDAEAPAARPTAVKSSVRQSVPARDRAQTYRGDEIFRNSRVAMPLLVADLEPKAMTVARPMSGRSVGARPAAAWTRPAVELKSASNNVPVSGTSWAARGRSE